MCSHKTTRIRVAAHLYIPTSTSFTHVQTGHCGHHPISLECCSLVYDCPQCYVTMLEPTSVAALFMQHKMYNSCSTTPLQSLPVYTPTHSSKTHRGVRQPALLATALKHWMLLLTQTMWQYLISKVKIPIGCRHSCGTCFCAVLPSHGQLHSYCFLFKHIGENATTLSGSNLNFELSA